MSTEFAVALAFVLAFGILMDILNIKLIKKDFANQIKEKPQESVWLLSKLRSDIENFHFSAFSVSFSLIVSLVLCYIISSTNLRLSPANIVLLTLTAVYSFYHYIRYRYIKRQNTVNAIESLFGRNTEQAKMVKRAVRLEENSETDALHR